MKAVFPFRSCGVVLPVLMAAASACHRTDPERQNSTPLASSVRGAPLASLSAAPLPKASADFNAPGATEGLRAFLTQWLEAQNQGAFEKYQAFYAPKFTGTKRVGSQVYRFNRPRWLLDRKGMLAHSLKVTASGVSVVDLGKSAILRFEQTFESGSFRDVGQKQLTLVREGESWLIAREEMLTSFPAVPAGVLAFPALALVEPHGSRNFVLLEKSNLEPAAPELVDYELAVSSLRDESSLPPGRRGLAGQSLVLYGEKGEVCRGKARRMVLAARAEPHEGMVATWSGHGDDPAPSRPAIAREIFDLSGDEGRYLALEMEANPSCKGAVFARAEALPPAEPYLRRAPSVAETKSALAAFRALPLYQKNQKDFLAEGKKGDWVAFDEHRTEIRVFEGRGGKWLTVSAQAGVGCGDYRGEGFALFRLDTSGKLTLASDGTAANWLEPLAVADADGDGVPEVIASEFHLLQSQGGQHRVVLDLHAPVFACGC